MHLLKSDVESEEINTYDGDSLTSIIYDVNAFVFELQKFVDEKLEEIGKEINFIEQHGFISGKKNTQLLFLRKQQEILIELRNEKIRLEELIHIYEESVNVLFRKTILNIHQEQKEKNIETMNLIAFKIAALQHSLLFLDEQITRIAHSETIRIDQEKKTRDMIMNLMGNNKSFRKDHHLSHEVSIYTEKTIEYQKKLDATKKRSGDLEKKVLELRKIAINEEIKRDKSELSQMKQISFQENEVKAYLQKQKILQKALFLQRDKLINQDKKQQSESNKIIQRYTTKSINETLHTILKNLYEKKDQDENKSVIDELSILLSHKQTEINLFIVEMELFCNQKYCSLVDAWLLLDQKAPHAYLIETLTKNLDGGIIKEKIEALNHHLASLSEWHDTITFFVQNNEKINHDLQIILIETLNRLSEMNEKTRILEKQLNDIHFIAQYIRGELHSKSFWGRSEYSIDLNSIKSLLPHCKEIVKIFSSMTKRSFKRLFGKYDNEFSFNHILWIISCFILFTLGGFIAHRWSKIMINKFFEWGEKHQSKIKFIVILQFLLNYFIPFYTFTAILIFFKVIMQNIVFTSLFLLLSIPIGWLFLYKIMQEFLAMNERRGFAFIPYSSIRHFIYFFLSFCFPHCALLLLYEALSHFIPYASNDILSILPIIRAIQFLLLQINLLTVLRKETVLRLIPEQNERMRWIKGIFFKYYRLFLSFIALIIVMSNPYVGYGSQVFYFISRFLLTSLAIPLIYYLFNKIKREMIDFFIDSRDGEIINRFTSAKSLYILCATILFLLMIICSILIISFLWGLGINMEMLQKIIRMDLISAISSDQTANIFTLFDITKVFIFTIGGYIGAYVTNNLIIAKIVEPMFMNPIVQFTLFTLIRYIMVTFGFIIGLYAAGLQSLTTKIALIIGIFSFAIKEPFADFVSYFIILIQRPIKIGDLIRISGSASGNLQDIVGIVRKINPRTTIIRQRNSVNVVVPNSVIISKLLYNWNYNRAGYVGLEDIILHVGFGENPENVRIILIKCLDNFSTILKNPHPIVRCEDFTQSGFQFLIRGFISVDKVPDLFDITAHLRIVIATKLESEGITITPPHHIISITKENLVKK